MHHLQQCICTLPSELKALKRFVLKLLNPQKNKHTMKNILLLSIFLCLLCMRALATAPPTVSPSSIVLCVNQTHTFTGSAPAGTWSSSNADINLSTTGPSTTCVVTGAYNSSGVGVVLTYTNSNGVATASVTVNPLPNIAISPELDNAAGYPILYVASMGGHQVCSVTVTSDIAGGTWSSSLVGAGYAVFIPITSSSAEFTEGSGPSGISTPQTITYTAATGCKNTRQVMIDQLNGIYTIHGGEVCPGLTLACSNTSIDGTWSTPSSNFSVMGTSPDGTTGLITGITAGSGTLYYTVTPEGPSCYSYETITVEPNPAPITGTTEVCIGHTTHLYDASTLPSASWSSSNTYVASVAASGVVTGNHGGTATITYTLLTSAGCYATTQVTVDPRITGPTSVCFGSSITLADAGGTGTWTSSNTSVATIGLTTGIITTGGPGMTTGTATIYYTGGTSGCSDNVVITVLALPNATMVSTSGTYCGSTTITANNSGDGTMYFQGTTSGGTSTATPSASELITTSGTYYFRALSSNGCWGNEGSATIVINPLPTPVTVSGTTPACGSTVVSAVGGSGGTIYFEGTTSGGMLTTMGSTPQTVSASGTYYFNSLSSAGCWGTQGSITVIINSLPDPIGGASSVCLGSTTALNDGTGGGTWSSSNGNATITSDGTVTGVTAGTSTIAYTLGDGCAATFVITINDVSQPTVYCSATPPNFGFLLIESESGVTEDYTVDINDGTYTYNAPGLTPLLLTSGTALTLTNISNIDVPYPATWTIKKIYGVTVNYDGCSWPNACGADRLSSGGATGIDQNQQIKAALSVTPNPNIGSFTLSGLLSTSTSKEAKIEVEDVLGKIVYRDVAAIENGGVNKTINLGDNIPSGVYLIKVTNDNSSKVIRVSIER